MLVTHLFLSRHICAISPSEHDKREGKSSARLRQGPLNHRPLFFLTVHRRSRDQP